MGLVNRLLVNHCEFCDGEIPKNSAFVLRTRSKFLLNRINNKYDKVEENLYTHTDINTCYRALDRRNSKRE